MAGLYARHLGVRKVIVNSNRDNYLELLGAIGLDSAVSTKQATGNAILRTVRARGAADAVAAIERLYRIIDGEVEALEFVVRREDSFIRIPLKDMSLKPDALIAVIVRFGQVFIPFGHDVLQEGDRVIVLIKGGGVERLDDVMETVKA